VAMESTGVYWIPLFQKLEEAGFEVLLVDARQAKHVPGRKSDVQDCRWLQQLHSYGLLRAAFRPEDGICRLRTFQRHRKNLVECAGMWIQRMEKASLKLEVWGGFYAAFGSSTRSNPILLARFRSDWRICSWYLSS
jgi:transposase